MKIYINDKEIETDKTLLFAREFLAFTGNCWAGLCEEKYNVMLEVSDKYWEDVPCFAGKNEFFNIKEGMRFKVFPKASMSSRGGPYF